MASLAATAAMLLLGELSNTEGPSDAGATSRPWPTAALLGAGWLSKVDSWSPPGPAASAAVPVSARDWLGADSKVEGPSAVPATAALAVVSARDTAGADSKVEGPSAIPATAAAAPVSARDSAGADSNV